MPNLAQVLGRARIHSFYLKEKSFQLNKVVEPRKLDYSFD